MYQLSGIAKCFNIPKDYFRIGMICDHRPEEVSERLVIVK
jgi:hypothetical protein